MEQLDAIQLITGATIPRDAPQLWADLGCGRGTFTRALASLLPAGSTIYAVDREKQQLPKQISGVEIVFSQADFEQDDFPFHDLDGMLIANALHYSKDAETLLQRLMGLQRKAQEQFMIIEYDSNNANRWVPYPLSFIKLKNDSDITGFFTHRETGRASFFVSPGKYL